MRVLLSAVGKSDPMTCLQDDVHDGAILHICRYYLPDKVFLYMSQQICEFDSLDHRYEKALQLLGKSLDHIFEIEKIQKKDLQNVHLFDHFYEDFEKIILNIVKHYGEEAEILINLSSGTPAMKSAFQIISALSKYRITPIQVSDPSHGKQQRSDHLIQYDVDTYWELNLDRLKECKNRCFIAEYSQFSFKVQKEIIAQLIKDYDYEAAYTLIKTYAHKFDSKLLLCSEFALSRYKLDTRSCRNIQNKLGITLLPYKQEGKTELFEYGLFLKLKRDKGDYLDVVRGINPFMYSACKMALEIFYHVDILQYIDGKNLKVEKLCRDDLGKDIKKSLDLNFSKQGGYRDTYLTENQMLIYLSYKDKNSRIVKELEKLNDLRENLRNVASHQITSIKEDSIQKKLGHDMDYYMTSIKNVLTLLGYDMKLYWHSYDDMNECLLNMLFS